VFVPVVSNEGPALAVPTTGNVAVTPIVANEGAPPALDDNTSPGDGSNLFDPANWADFDAGEREEIPGWLDHALGNGQVHVTPGHRLSLLIQAMAAMPLGSAETTGVMAVEPPPPMNLVVPGT
jgi:hypothetical protein